VIVAAHSTSLLSAADRVVWMEAGRVVRVEDSASAAEESPEEAEVDAGALFVTAGASGRDVELVAQTA
jgi:ABC-type glutathione transport system ATPase component